MIVSRQNRRLQEIRRLRKRRGDRAILEGPKLLAEALEAGVPIQTVLASTAFLDSDSARRIVPQLPRPPLEVAEPLLAELADADSPRGLLAVVELPRGGAEALPVLEGGVYLWLDRLQDPSNLGAVARAAEATGAAGLTLGPGSVHPNHPRAIRASAGSLLRLPVAVGVTPRELADRLESVSPRWLALATRGGRDPMAADLDGALVLALGSEGSGLGKALESLAPLELTVPIAPPVESLNAAVAVAVVLFEIRRRRRPAAD